MTIDESVQNAENSNGFSVPLFGIGKDAILKEFGRKTHNPDDHLNLTLARACYFGIHQMESDSEESVLKSVSDLLETADIIALPIGIQIVKGELFDPKKRYRKKIGERIREVSGLWTPELVSYLVGRAYSFNPSGKHVRSAIRNIKDLTSKEKGPYIAERLSDRLSDETQIRFMDRFYKRFKNEVEIQERSYWEEFDMFEANALLNPNSSDHYEVRRTIARELIHLVNSKHPNNRPYTRDRALYKVPSDEIEGNFYLVKEIQVASEQQNLFGEMMYRCSCPDFLFDTFKAESRRTNCKHIHDVQAGKYEPILKPKPI